MDSPAGQLGLFSVSSGSIPSCALGDFPDTICPGKLQDERITQGVITMWDQRNVQIVLNVAENNYTNWTGDVLPKLIA